MIDRGRLQWGILLLSVLLLAASGCGPATSLEPAPTPVHVLAEKYATSGTYAETLTIDGVVREFLIHIPPSYRLDTPLPLVINMHGRGATVLHQERLSAMFTKADEEGFIVASPQAVGRPATWWPAPGPLGQADLEFFQAMIERIESQINVDPARIYATGFSNGGAMANRLACAMSDKIAAIAPVAGAHPQMESCQPMLPVSVIVFHGSRDGTVPYLGDGGYLPPVPAWAAAWARRNDCEAKPAVDHPHTTATRETWMGCSGDAAVVLYTIEGGGHDWPGAAFGPGPYPDGIAPGLYATDVIWGFFEAHPRRFEP